MAAPITTQNLEINCENYWMVTEIKNKIIQQLLVIRDSMGDLDKSEPNNMVICLSSGCHTFGFSHKCP